MISQVEKPASAGLFSREEDSRAAADDQPAPFQFVISITLLRVARLGTRPGHASCSHSTRKLQGTPYQMATRVPLFVKLLAGAGSMRRMLPHQRHMPLHFHSGRQHFPSNAW